MEIWIDGSRSTNENWMLAQKASPDVLPELSNAQKDVADKLGISHDAYARSFYAGELTRSELGARAERAARIVERLAQSKVSGVVLDSVWLKTFTGKFRFDLDLGGSRALILVDEGLMDKLLDSGSKAAEERIARIVGDGLPASWAVKAS